ncbi:MAG TPA: thiamine phosphate synthase, partial [Spirochaetota bacterium]|nr:thiamine phosphate synthase [Spirochaetota bacterium]
MRDWSLYLVTDRAMLAGREYIQTVLQAVSGGVTAVQLREKELPTRELVTLAKALVQ